MTRSTSDRLVCFDLGGVLVRYHTAWTDACRAAGLDVRALPDEAQAELARLSCTELFMAGSLSEDEWIDRMVSAMGHRYRREEVRAMHDAVLLGEYPGVGELIDDLHAANVATACLSNTNHSHWARIVHHDGVRALAGEPEYPNVMRLRSHHASHLMRMLKPDESIYRAFEAATGFEGSQILFFDDVPQNVEAARQVGWVAHHVQPDAGPVVQIRALLEREWVIGAPVG